MPVELITDMCSYEEAFVQTTEQNLSTDAKTTCSKTKMHQVVGQSKLPMTTVVMNSECYCPHLSRRSIVFYKQAQVNGNKVMLDKESYIVKLSSGLASDLRQLKAQCATTD